MNGRREEERIEGRAGGREGGEQRELVFSEGPLPLLEVETDRGISTFLTPTLPCVVDDTSR